LDSCFPLSWILILVLLTESRRPSGRPTRSTMQALLHVSLSSSGCTVSIAPSCFRFLMFPDPSLTLPFAFGHWLSYSVHRHTYMPSLYMPDPRGRRRYSSSSPFPLFPSYFPLVSHCVRPLSVCPISFHLLTPSASLVRSRPQYTWVPA
jgi:hypothetical protein